MKNRLGFALFALLCAIIVGYLMVATLRGPRLSALSENGIVDTNSLNLNGLAFANTTNVVDQQKNEAAVEEYSKAREVALSEVESDIRLFNHAYLMKYHSTDSTNRWLQYDNDSSLQYPYSLDFSHPDWTLRCAHLILLETQSQTLRSEAQEFLSRSAAPALLEKILNQDAYSNLKANTQPNVK